MIRLKTALAVVVFAVALAALATQAAEPDPQHAPQHAIAMHGAPKYGPGFTHFDYVNPGAPKGGTLRLAGLGGFDSFNAFIAKGEVADGIGGIYDTLLTASADEAFTEYGLLAESVETPADRSWVTFRLRPEAKWHDGKPITADDVVWTFTTRMAKGTPSFQFYYASVDKLEALDARTVKFTFKPGDNRELPLILGQMEVLPRHYWEGRDFGKTTLEPPLGSGPYKIGKFEPGRYIEYERVADYWGKHLPVSAGQSNFDVIRYEYFRDANVTVEAFKGGAIDFRAENNSKIWATAYDIPEVADGRIVKEGIPHQRPLGMQGFAFNMRRDLFKDARVRRALGYAFDFEWSNKNLFYGQYVRTRSFFDNSELAATGLPSADELKILEPYRGRVPDDVFTTEYHPPSTEGDGRIRDNLKEADRLLKEAGWEIKGKQRVHTATGQALSFEMMLVQPDLERIVLPFAKNLERLGVEMRVRTVDTPQYIERMRNFDFDMMVTSWGQSLSPGNEQRDFWGSAAAQQPSSRNLVGIQDPVIDDLIELVISAPDRESLVTRVRALDRVLQWGHYVIPNFHIGYDRVIYWNKFSRPAVTPTQGMQMGTWWYDEAKARALGAAPGGN